MDERTDGQTNSKLDLSKTPDKFEGKRVFKCLKLLQEFFKRVCEDLQVFPFAEIGFGLLLAIILGAVGALIVIIIIQVCKWQSKIPR